jgi:hypothetical protein
MKRTGLLAAGIFALPLARRLSKFLPIRALLQLAILLVESGQYVRSLKLTLMDFFGLRLNKTIRHFHVDSMLFCLLWTEEL